jgi:hypothetical protein
VVLVVTVVAVPIVAEPEPDLAFESEVVVADKTPVSVAIVPGLPPAIEELGPGALHYKHLQDQP